MSRLRLKSKKLGKSARILWYRNLKRRPHVFREVIQEGSCPPGSPASSLRTRNVGFIVTALFGKVFLNRRLQVLPTEETPPLERRQRLRRTGKGIGARNRTSKSLRRRPRPPRRPRKRPSAPPSLDSRPRSPAGSTSSKREQQQPLLLLPLPPPPPSLPRRSRGSGIRTTRSCLPRSRRWPKRPRGEETP